MTEKQIARNPNALLLELERDDNGKYDGNLYWQKHVAEIWLRRSREGTDEYAKELLETVFEQRGVAEPERMRVRSKLKEHGFLL